MYLSQEELGCLDPAQRDHSWDMLPESEGNVWGDPGHCPSETMTSRVGGPVPGREASCLWLAVAGLASPQKCVLASGTHNSGHFPIQHLPCLLPAYRSQSRGSQTLVA